MSNYQTQIILGLPRSRVFEAISKELGLWWGQQDNLIEKENDVFTVSWEGPWYQFRVLKFKKNEEMVWECIDANQIIDGLKGVQKEWVGTRVHWSLNSSDGKTILDFEHEGLVPEFVCFDFCSKVWSDFLKNSLVNYLEST